MTLLLARWAYSVCHPSRDRLHRPRSAMAGWLTDPLYRDLRAQPAFPPRERRGFDGAPTPFGCPPRASDPLIAGDSQRPG